MTGRRLTEYSQILEGWNIIFLETCPLDFLIKYEKCARPLPRVYAIFLFAIE